MGDGEKRIPYGDYVLIAESLSSKHRKQFCVGRISLDEWGTIFFSVGNNRQQKPIIFITKTTDDGIYEFYTDNTSVVYMIKKIGTRWFISVRSKKTSKVLWNREILLQRGMKEFLSWFVGLRFYWVMR